MATPGPAKTPTVIKEARGTLEKSRVSPAEPQWKPLKTDTPAELVGEDAIEEWKRLVAELDPQGLLPAPSRGVLIGLCNSWGTYMNATRKLAADGWVFVAQSGYEMPSAWVAIRGTALKEYNAGIVQFGATPSSAGKVTARPKGEDADELAKARAERRAAR